MTHLITLSTFWTETLPGTWLAVSSPHLLLDLFSLLLTRGGRTSHQSVFVNPHDSSHHTKHLLDGNLAGHLAGRVFTTPAPGLIQPAVDQRRRNFPPGQIQLDRFPEGFNFNFRSQQG